jgi:hypothetical protein
MGVTDGEQEYKALQNLVMLPTRQPMATTTVRTQDALFESVRKHLGIVHRHAIVTEMTVRRVSWIRRLIGRLLANLLVR